MPPNNNEQQNLGIADANRQNCSRPISGVLRSTCRVFSSAYQAYSNASERAQPYVTMLNTLAVFFGTWSLLFYFSYFKNGFGCEGRPFDLSCPDANATNGTDPIIQLEDWLGEGTSDEFRQSVVHGLGIAGLQVIFMPLIIVSAPILGVGLDKLVEGVRQCLYGSSEPDAESCHTNARPQHRQLTKREYLTDAFSWSSHLSKGTAILLQLILLVSWFPQQLNTILESLGCQSRNFWQVLTMTNDNPDLNLDDPHWGCSPVNFTKAYGGAVGKWWLAIVTSFAFSYALFNSISLASLYWQDQVIDRIRQFKNNWRNSRSHAGALTAYNTGLTLMAVSPPILLWRMIQGIKEANTVLHWEGCQSFLKALTVTPLGYGSISSGNIEPLDEKIPESLQKVLESFFDYDVTELTCALKQVLESGLAYTFQAEIATLFMWGPLVGVSALALGYVGGWINAACIGPSNANNDNEQTPEQANRECHLRKKLDNFIQRLEAFKNKMTQDWYEPMQSIFKSSLYTGIGLTVLFYGLPWLHQLLDEYHCSFGDALRAQCDTSLLAMALGVNGNIPWAVGTASAFTGLSGFFVYRLFSIAKDKYWPEEVVAERQSGQVVDQPEIDGLSIASVNGTGTWYEAFSDYDEEGSQFTQQSQPWHQRLLQFLGCTSGRARSMGRDSFNLHSGSSNGPRDTRSDVGTTDGGRDHQTRNPRQTGRRWYWPDVDTSTRAGNPFDQSHDEPSLAGGSATSYMRRQF